MQIEKNFSIHIIYDDVKQKQKKLYLPENIAMRFIWLP
jgi:hypothetical protein